MLPDLFPCPFHLRAPVDIIKYHHCSGMTIAQQLVKIIYGGLVAVVTIHIGQVNRRYLLQDKGQHE